MLLKTQAPLMDTKYAHTASKTFLSIALVLAIAPALFLGTIDPKFGIMWFSLFVCAGVFMLRRETTVQELVVAFLCALLVASYHKYVYTTGNIMLGRINLFPVVAWTAGLFLLREVYEQIHLKSKLLIVSAVYLCMLFLLEYTGYYMLNIRLESHLPSLFGLGIIHAPVFVQVFYLTAGPLYLLITDYLRFK